jgi:ubiquitin carboxyl-terminal hydrolase 5/13
MGFERKQAIASLKLTNGNIEEALNLIYTNPNIGNEKNEENKMDIEDKKEDKKEEKNKELEEDKIINEGNGSIYNLYGFITHLGKSTECGHYVSHIKKENKWIYFNDIKVSLLEDPPIKKGYIYFYRNLSNENNK